jgi:uncharacterized protein (DUF924 family)
VLEYWFGAGDAKPNFKLWFQADKQVDEEIIRRFGPTVEEALQGSRGLAPTINWPTCIMAPSHHTVVVCVTIAGGLREWETAPRPMLAKMIVLDQVHARPTRAPASHTVLRAR